MLPFEVPLHGAMDAIDELRLFVDSYGIVAAGGQTALLEALRRHKKTRVASLSERHWNEERERTRRIDDFSKDLGVSYLFGFATVQMWSILESVVDELLRVYLKDREHWKSNEVVKSLKGSFVEFVYLDQEQQLDVLMEHFKFAVKSSQQLGIGRFECILEKIGLGGSTVDSIRTVIFEMGQARNILVHQRGIADATFVRQCPWFGATAGQKIRFTQWHFARYEASMLWYVTQISRRMYIAATVEAGLEKALTTYEEFVAKLGVKAPEAVSHKQLVTAEEGQPPE
jgi:hypothetical protein